MICKIKRMFGLVSMAFLVGWLFSCKNGVDPVVIPEEPEVPELVLNEQAIIMEAETLAKLQGLDDSGMLTFTGLSIEETPKVGSILIAAPSENAPYGFLCKVIGVQQDGDSTRILTEEASIADVIVSGELSSSFDLNDHILGFFDEDDNPLDYEPVSAARTSGRAARNTTGDISIPVAVPIFEGRFSGGEYHPW